MRFDLEIMRCHRSNNLNYLWLMDQITQLLGEPVSAFLSFVHPFRRTNCENWLCKFAKNLTGTVGVSSRSLDVSRYVLKFRNGYAVNKLYSLRNGIQGATQTSWRRKNSVRCEGCLTEAQSSESRQAGSQGGREEPENRSGLMYVSLSFVLYDCFSLN